MSTKTMFGAQPRKVQPGGFTKPNRSRKGTADIRESARAWLNRRGIEQFPYQHNSLFDRKPSA